MPARGVSLQRIAVQEVLPKAGLVVSEKGNLSEILCKPKIMPLKSITLQKLEEMEVSWTDVRSTAILSESCPLCIWPLAGVCLGQRMVW